MGTRAGNSSGRRVASRHARKAMQNDLVQAGSRDVPDNHGASFRLVLYLCDCRKFAGRSIDSTGILAGAHSDVPKLINKLDVLVDGQFLKLAVHC